MRVRKPIMPVAELIANTIFWPSLNAAGMYRRKATPGAEEGYPLNALVRCVIPLVCEVVTDDEGPASFEI